MREPDVGEFPLYSWLFTRTDEASVAAALAYGADAVVVSGAPRRDGRSVDGPKIVAALADASEEEWDAIMAAAPWAIFADCRSGADVQRLGVKLAVREASYGLIDGSTRIVASVGAAESLLNLASFAGSSPRLVALTLDAMALRRDLSAPRAQLAPSLGRGLILLAAAAAGVAAIDGPAESGDIRVETERSLSEGFSGKIARSTGEVAVINEVFRRGRAGL